MANATHWTRCTAQRENGSFCDAQSLPDAPFPICVRHAAQVYEFLRDSVHVAVKDSDRSMHLVVDVLSRRQEINKHLDDVANAVVYYVQIGEHINATILTQYLDPVSRWWSDLIVSGLMFLFVSALTYYSITAAVFAVEVQQVALGAITIPIWPVKIVLAIGFALFALQLRMSIISLLINDRPRKSDV